MRFLQINLNHGEVAQDLLTQTVREDHIDVVIISEQYRNRLDPSWRTDTTGSAAIWACGNRPIQEIMKTPAEYFVRAKVNGVHIYSCYMPPRLTQQEYEGALDRLVNDANNRHPVIIAGDFNAWAVEWGSKRTTERGRALLEAFSVLNLTLLNDGKVPTFTRGESRSTIDLTFVSPGLSKNNCWKVTEICTHSDHCAITWLIQPLSKCENRLSMQAKTIRWKAKALDKGSLCVCIEDAKITTRTAEEKTKQVMDAVMRACDAAMPRCGDGNQHAPAYWWSDTIAELRAQCKHARRLAQRARKRPTFPQLEMAFKEARSQLAKAIKHSKREGWTRLMAEVNSDPFGRPYRVVMSTIKTQSRQQPTCPMQLGEIVAVLFPKQPAYDYPVPRDESEVVPPITQEELFRATRRMGNTKTPGLDNIPNTALKTAIEAAPELFLEMYNSCLSEGTFPVQWKRQRLVLLPKGNKPPEEASSYRPLCMLDTAGKILERIISNRIDASVGHRLAENQYGFRRGMSTIEAIGRVVAMAKDTISGARWTRGAKKYCLLAALDVKNAFNSARWDSICKALDQLGTPTYLRAMIKSYFCGRLLMYDTENGPEHYEVSGGVPQGSVLGPLLWNLMYDALLKTQLPQGAEMVAFADDAGLVITAKTLEEVNCTFGEAYDTVRGWMQSVGLELAHHKTEAVLFTSRKKVETITLDVGDCEITSQPYIRYLGVMLDVRLSFKQHIESVAAKGAKVGAALARLMPNIGGPKQARRTLLATVITSILLYAAPIWHEALKVASYRREMVSVYRTTLLRVAAGYRTISYEAVCVVAGMPPLEILADERSRIYTRGRRTPLDKENIAKEEKAASLLQWQQRWDESSKGRWTHRLIPSLQAWMNRNHGEVGFYLTQFLTDHGCFRKYLHRFKLDDNEDCPTCNVAENAEHVFFTCPRYNNERDQLQEHLNKRITPDNIVNIMLNAADSWSSIEDYATTVLKKLRAEERQRHEPE